MHFHFFLDYFVLFLFWHSCFCGRITEDKLLKRYEESLDGEDVDSDGRPRRQLPTEINIQVTAPLFTARLYDYGEADGDKQVPASVDVGMRLSLTQPILFFGQKYKEVYILSNGGIGFEQNARNYKNNIVKTGPAIIAPLWNRNDLRKGGKIFYREITEGRAIERAQSEVRYQYDKNVKPISVILVTWVNMQPNGEQTISLDNTNTVQTAIINSENGTYANLIYKSIGWSQGAEAGFGKGDGQSFYNMPSSGTDNIMYLKDYGNTGIPGEWIFEIGREKIIRCKPGIKGDTCDDECAEFEWGPDCDNCCHCAKGRCNVQTGECNGNECKQCWSGPPLCNKREQDCKARQKECGFNAISFTDFDRCGEPVLRCQCLSGFVGDGMNCSDVDECKTKRPCHKHAICLNTPGRYYCECEPGYTGNGTQCTAFITKQPTSLSQSSTTSKLTEITNAVVINNNKTQTVASSPVETSTALSPSTEVTTELSLFEDDASTLDAKQQSDKHLQQFFESVTSLNVQNNNTFTLPATFAPSSESAFTNTTDNVTLGTDNVTDWLSPTPPSLSPISKHENDTSAATGKELPTSTLMFDTSHYSNSFVSYDSSTLSPEISSTFEDDDFSSKLSNKTVSESRSKPSLEDQPKILPKETNAHLIYALKKPLMILGKMRHKLTIWSTGVVALDDVPPLNPDNDLELAKIQGFAPFFGKIDLGKDTGKVSISETSDFEMLSDASTMVQHHFHNPGFSAKSVITVMFENVTSPNGQFPNNFEVILVGGTNVLGENATFVEYIYNDLQWADDAKAMILSADATKSLVLPGSGSENIRQLAKQSNIKVPGEWMFRVDLQNVEACPPGTFTPPFCETGASTQASVLYSSELVPHLITPRTGGASKHPLIDFEDNGQTVTFPAFITLVPQLITPGLAGIPTSSGSRGQLPTPSTNSPSLLITGSSPTENPSPLSSQFPLNENRIASVIPSSPLAVFSISSSPDVPTPSQFADFSNTHQEQHQTSPTVQSISSFSDHGTSSPIIFRTVGVLNVTANRDDSVSLVTGSSATADVPPLQIFTASTKKPARLPVPTKSSTPPRIVTAVTNKGGGSNNQDGNGAGNSNEDSRKAGLPPFGVDDQDSLNSPSKLAIIIPTAIVGVWLLLLVVIGVVVCCRRRNTRKRMRSKYDPSYHFRHMVSHQMPRGKEANLASSSQSANGYPQASYEDHLDKAARLAEMTQYGGQSGRAAMYGSYWNVPGNSRQQPYNYYNQGYYDSCPEFSRYNYSGRY